MSGRCPSLIKELHVKIEMLSTGDEVLYGQITDTNASWLAETLFSQGLVMTHRSTVGDSLDSLVEELTQRSQVADVLIVNGGLGPTSDDLSALAAATACGVPLEMNKPWLAHIEDFFSQRGQPMAPQNRKQAEIPQSAEMINNRAGTACGFSVTLNGCRIFFTPGVPFEFKIMVTEQILPRLQQQFSLPEPPLCLRMTTFGRGESSLAALLEAYPLPEGVTMGYRAAMPVVEIKLTGPQRLKAPMLALWQQIREALNEWVLFEGTQGLPAQLAALLSSRGLSLVISEMYTAGLVHWQLAGADVPLRGGELPVSVPETLAQLGERAAALARKSGAELALVIGGLDNESLGLALMTPEGIQAERLTFNSRRHSLAMRQELISTVAMNRLQRWLQGKSAPQSYSWLTIIERLPPDV